MTRVTQTNRISEINCNILKMAGLVQNQVLKSMETVKDTDLGKVEDIIKDDDYIDDIYQLIEEECIKFIATEQPLAKDLRRVFTAAKVATDLERMADYAVDICKASKSINIDSPALLKEAEDLWNMKEQVIEMISMSVNAYLRGGVKDAYEICKLDDIVDGMYRSIFRRMMNIIKNEDADSNSAAHILFVAKYLERIGDRVTNICEGIIFAKKGIYTDLNE